MDEHAKEIYERVANLLLKTNAATVALVTAVDELTTAVSGLASEVSRLERRRDSVVPAE